MGVLASSPLECVVSFTVRGCLEHQQEKLLNMWAKPKEKVDLEDPKPFINQVYVACAQREVQVNDEILWRGTTIIHETNHH